MKSKICEASIPQDSEICNQWSYLKEKWIKWLQTGPQKLKNLSHQTQAVLMGDTSRNASCLTQNSHIQWQSNAVGIFLEKISSAVDTNDDLDESKKLTYLQQAIVDKKASDLLATSSDTTSQHAKLVETLKDRFDQKRLIYREHVKAIVNVPTMKAGTHKEVCDMYDTINKHVSGLQDC